MTTSERREEIANVLKGLGLTDMPEEYDDGIHGWRCSHPDLYGRCSCFEEAVDALLARFPVLAGVTDEMVDAGARAIERYDEDQPSGPFNIHEDNRGKARAVLVAAREARTT